MYIQRTLDLPALLRQKSFFLLGPRTTGKSSLIRHQLKDSALIINLLRSDLFLKLSAQPWLLEDLIEARTATQNIIVIDEIQKIPALLNEVHRLIEEKQLIFLLTGSSARKLKQQEVNLLAGRAWKAELFPLTFQEIPDFDINRYLRYGGLPAIYLSENPEEALLAYVDTYLKEEIQAEALVRKLQSFSKFLQMAALCNGTILNYANLSSDLAIPASTIRKYYQILEDTLIGFLLQAWTKSKKRKAISTAKFYLFDVGVANQLCERRSIEPNSDLFGNAFEHFIAMELKAHLSYHRRHLSLSYWRSTAGHEVDFIVGNDIAIEVKTTHHVTDKHLKGLLALQEEQIIKKYYLISFDKVRRQSKGIEIIHWQDFLKGLTTFL